MFEEERFIGRLQHRVTAEKELVACFLSGSYGRGAADPYSDVDIALVFGDDQARDAAWPERRQFVRSIMPYVAARSFDAVHVRPFFHIVLYANGTKADFRYESAASLEPNPWDRQMRLLKDENQWGVRYQQRCAETFAPERMINAEELKAIDDRFWVMFWDTLRLLGRGDRAKPYPIYLEVLHFTMPRLLAALPPGDEAGEGLLRAYYGRDVVGTREAMGQLLVHYVAARQALVGRYNLPFEGDKAFEREITRLVERLAAPPPQ
jgi:Nucleotidyltransferase domain